MFAILRLVGERADDNQTATEHLGKA
jgi:hypothetical protein